MRLLRRFQAVLASIRELSPLMVCTTASEGLDRHATRRSLIAGPANGAQCYLPSPPSQGNSLEGPGFEIKSGRTFPFGKEECFFFEEV